MKTLTGVVVLVVCSVLLVPHARAQTRLIRQVIGSGAALATGTNSRMMGTVGQTIIGRVTSSSNVGMLGFWYTYPYAGTTGIESHADVAANASLQVSPNPASDQAAIRIGLPTGGHVALLVYDGLGRQRLELLREQLPAGVTTLPLECSQLASGDYTLVLMQGPMRLTVPLRVVH